MINLNNDTDFLIFWKKFLWEYSSYWEFINNPTKTFRDDLNSWIYGVYNYEQIQIMLKYFKLWKKEQTKFYNRRKKQIKLIFSEINI